MKLFEHPDFEQAIIQAADYFRSQGLAVDVFNRIAADEAGNPPYPVLNHIPYEEEDDDHVIRFYPAEEAA